MDSKANIGTPHTELYKHFVTFYYFCLNNLTYTFLKLKPFLSFIIMFLSLPADNSHTFSSFELHVVLCTTQTISLQMDSSRWILDCQYSTRKRLRVNSELAFWILKFTFTISFDFDKSKWSTTCHFHQNTLYIIISNINRNNLRSHFAVILNRSDVV